MINKLMTLHLKLGEEKQMAFYQQLFEREGGDFAALQKAILVISRLVSNRLL
jgi:hypothetical protein